MSVQTDFRKKIKYLIDLANMYRTPIGSMCLCSKYEKKCVKAVYCHSAYLTYMQRNIMRNAGLEETQAGIKIAGRNINTLRYADDTTLMAESE